MPGTIESRQEDASSQTSYAGKSTNSRRFQYVVAGVISSNRDKTNTSLLVDIRPGTIINFPANLKRQFYPPIMLLEALSRPTVLEKRSHDDTSSRGDEYDPQQIFHHFVNRLALICQVEPNGDAVSSCVVTQEPDKVVYVFASNHRTEAQLTVVAQALRGILEMVPPLEDSADVDPAEIRDKMLREVLALSWCRVRRYLKGLAKELGNCIASCQRSQNQRGMF